MLATEAARGSVVGVGEGVRVRQCGIRIDLIIHIWIVSQLGS